MKLFQGRSKGNAIQAKDELGRGRLRILIDKVDVYFAERKEAREFLREARRLEKIAKKHKKNEHFEDAGLSYKQAAELAMKAFEITGGRRVKNRCNELFDKAIKCYKTGKIYEGIGECYAKLGEHKKAASCYGNAAQNNWGAKAAELYILAAKNFIIVNKHEFASVAYEKAAEKYYNLAYTVRESKKEIENFSKAADCFWIAAQERSGDKRELLYLKAADAYHTAASHEINKARKIYYLIYAAEARIEGGQNNSAGNTFGNAADLENNPDKKIQLYMRAGEQYTKAANHVYSGSVYKTAANLEETTPKKIEYYLLAAKNYTKKAMEPVDPEKLQYPGYLEEYLRQRTESSKYAGQAYVQAADLEENKEAKFEYLLLALRSYLRAGLNTETNLLSKNIINEAGGEKDSITKIIICKIVEEATAMAEDELYYKSAATAYRLAAGSETETSKKIEYWIAAGAILEKIPDYGQASGTYAYAAELEQSNAKKLEYLLKKAECTIMNYLRRKEELYLNNVEILYGQIVEDITSLDDPEVKQKITQQVLDFTVSLEVKYTGQSNGVIGTLYKEVAELFAGIERTSYLTKAATRYLEDGVYVSYALSIYSKLLEQEDTPEKKAEFRKVVCGRIIERAKVQIEEGKYKDAGETVWALSEFVKRELKQETLAAESHNLKIDEDSGIGEIEKLEEIAVEGFLTAAKRKMENGEPKAAGASYTEAAKFEKTKAHKVEYRLLAAANFVEAKSYSDVGSSYRFAAEHEDDSKKKAEYSELAGDNFINAKEYDRASSAYLEISDRGVNFVKIKEKAISALIKLAETKLESRNCRSAAEAYSKAVELSENKDEIRKMALGTWMKEAENDIRSGQYEYAVEAYEHALNLEIDEHKITELKEKSLVCTVLTGNWKKVENELKTVYPGLYACLISPEDEKAAELDKRFLIRMRTIMPVGQLTRALGIFQTVRKEVGMNPARAQSGMELVSKGIKNWEEKGFEEPEGIPTYFLFQTLAVVKDERQLETMRSLLATKTLRNSRDARKSIMWHLEDNGNNDAHMQHFYDVVNASSEKKVVKNLGYLEIARLLDSSFTTEGIENTGQFQQRINKTIFDFIEKRTPDERVKQRFLERIDEFNNSGFLLAIVTVYSKYSGYKDVLPLIDMALVATVMGDFEKIKFPTEEEIKGMDYLSEEQRKILLSATHQLEFLNDEHRRGWIENEKVETIASESVNEVEAARNDLQQKIKDMKYHFELHMHQNEGELERNFAFTGEYLELIRSMLENENKGSVLFKKLKQMEKIVMSVMEIERIDIVKVKEKEGEVKSQLRNLAQATRSLFTAFYGLNEENLNSLQAKMDIENLREMLLGNREKLTIKSLIAYDSSDPLHLILAGIEPENSGSCQRYDGTPGLMIGLSGYLLNSGNKIIRVENQDGIVVGRAILKVVEADGKPALFLERTYYRNSRSDTNVDKIIFELAKRKARRIGVPLLTTSVATNEMKTMQITTHGGLSPYEYSDALGGVIQGKKELTLKVSVMGEWKKIKMSKRSNQTIDNGTPFVSSPFSSPSM